MMFSWLDYADDFENWTSWGGVFYQVGRISERVIRRNTGIAYCTLLAAQNKKVWLYVSRKHLILLQLDTAILIDGQLILVIDFLIHVYYFSLCLQVPRLNAWCRFHSTSIP